MGWASGSEVAYQMIKSLKKNVKDDKAREKIYFDLITVLEDFDCDTLCECMEEDTVFDKVLLSMHPEWDED